MGNGLYSDLISTSSLSRGGTTYSLIFYQPAKNSVREPSEEEAKLRDKMIMKFPDNFVDKLGPNDRVNCKPIVLEVDERKADKIRPVSHIKPYDALSFT